MPKLGADMIEGRVVEWLKKPGEPIARGEVVLVIETDKSGKTLPRAVLLDKYILNNGIRLPDNLDCLSGDGTNDPY